jgi:hypothetical protein
MNRKVLLVAVALIIAVTRANAQERTVGLLLNEETSYKGYTLFAPPYPTIYLINNEGELVHSWNTEYSTERSMISEDGYLYRGINLDSIHPVFGKPIGGLEKQDWDGNVVWRFIYSGADYARHHDVEVLPNGNVLMVAYEVKDSAECEQAGRDPSKIKGGMLFIDYIVEVEPVGDSSANIVWEWHFWDHLVQDWFPMQGNWGIVGNHPELIDFNGGDQKKDWPHLNSVFYNEGFDQIIFNCAHTSEFYVVDHSTTTEEARGHTGGRYGKGGDILYRWGNPQLYDQGTAADRRLFSTHDAEFVPSGYVGAGNITTFNNGVGRNYSSIEEIVPPVDSNGNYTLSGVKYGPDSAIWTWIAPNPEDFYFPNGNGAQSLPNGNILACNGGEIFQITPAKDVVWRYINPVNNSGPVHQGDSITNNSVGGVSCYPSDYSGLAGRDLTPKGPIELAVQETAPANKFDLKLYPGIASRSATISYQLDMPGHVRIKIYNALGQQVRILVDESKPAGQYQVRWNGTDNSGCSLGSGVYFCSFQSGETSLQKRIVLIR